jgi:hypothetical protein
MILRIPQERKGSRSLAALLFCGRIGLSDVQPASSAVSRRCISGLEQVSILSLHSLWYYFRQHRVSLDCGKGYANHP